MNLVLLEVAQQIVNLLVLGHEVDLSQQLLPAKLVAAVDVRQKILYIQSTLDIIQILIIDGYARVTRLDNHSLHLFVGRSQLDGHDVDARAHNLLDLGIDKIDDSRQHLMLLRR